jgi:hypothetical protein
VEFSVSSSLTLINFHIFIPSIRLTCHYLICLCTEVSYFLHVLAYCNAKWPKLLSYLCHSFGILLYIFLDVTNENNEYHIYFLIIEICLNDLSGIAYPLIGHSYIFFNVPREDILQILLSYIKLDTFHRKFMSIIGTNILVNLFP